MFVISVNPGNLIQRAVQENMNSGGKVELDMHAPPTIRKMWIPAGGILLNKVIIITPLIIITYYISMYIYMYVCILMCIYIYVPVFSNRHCFQQPQNKCPKQATPLELSRPGPGFGMCHLLLGFEAAQAKPRSGWVCFFYPPHNPQSGHRPRGSKYLLRRYSDPFLTPKSHPHEVPRDPLGG